MLERLDECLVLYEATGDESYLDEFKSLVQEAYEDIVLDEKSNFNKFINNKVKKYENEKKKAEAFEKLASSGSDAHKARAQRLADEHRKIADTANHLDYLGSAYGLKRSIEKSKKGIAISPDDMDNIRYARYAYKSQGESPEKKI